MAQKISRRDMLKIVAASAAVASTGLVPNLRIFAAPAGQDQITLTFQENEKQYTDVIAAFKQQYPNIDIQFVNVTGIDHAEVATKILAMLAAGTPVNIGYAATEATQLYAGEGLAAPLTQRVQDAASDLMEYFADVSPVLVETDLYEGDLYQLPRDFNAANMYFNTALMKEAGLETPAEDWTKDDFVEYAKAMTGLGDQKDSYGYGWTNRLW
jgi:multiple sugar transport system substrate-binding protein